MRTRRRHRGHVKRSWMGPRGDGGDTDGTQGAQRGHRGDTEGSWRAYHQEEGLDLAAEPATGAGAAPGEHEV